MDDPILILMIIAYPVAFGIGICAAIALSRWANK